MNRKIGLLFTILIALGQISSAFAMRGGAGRSGPGRSGGISAGGFRGGGSQMRGSGFSGGRARSSGFSGGGPRTASPGSFRSSSPGVARPAATMGSRPSFSRPINVGSQTRPIMQRPTFARPQAASPAAIRPGTAQIQRPSATRPITSRPGQVGIARPGVSRPAITSPTAIRPGIGQIQRPSATRPIISKPSQVDAARPELSKPQTKPDIAKPAIDQPQIKRPTQPEAKGIADKTIADRKKSIADRVADRQISPEARDRFQKALKETDINKQIARNPQALQEKQKQAFNRFKKDPKFSRFDKNWARQRLAGKHWKRWHHGPRNWHRGWWAASWLPFNWGWGWNWWWNQGVWWWGGYPWWWWYNYDPGYFYETVYPVYVTYYQNVAGNEAYNYWDITNATQQAITVTASQGDENIVIESGQTQRVFHIPGNYAFTVQSEQGVREFNIDTPNITIE